MADLELRDGISRQGVQRDEDGEFLPGPGISQGMCENSSS